MLAWEPVGPPFLKPTRTFEDLVAWRGGFAVIEWRSGRGLGRATYEDDEAWAWIRGSRDGGRTWADDLTWVGGDGNCLGEVAIHDGIAVMTACVAGEVDDVNAAARIPAFWVAPLTADD